MASPPPGDAALPLEVVAGNAAPQGSARDGEEAARDETETETDAALPAFASALNDDDSDAGSISSSSNSRRRRRGEGRGGGPGGGGGALLRDDGSSLTRASTLRSGDEDDDDDDDDDDVSGNSDGDGGEKSRGTTSAGRSRQESGAVAAEAAAAAAEAEAEATVAITAEDADESELELMPPTPAVSTVDNAEDMDNYTDGRESVDPDVAQSARALASPSVPASEYAANASGSSPTLSPTDTRSPVESLTLADMQHCETTAEAAEAKMLLYQQQQAQQQSQQQQQQQQPSERGSSTLSVQQDAGSPRPLRTASPLLVPGSPRSLYRRRSSKAPAPEMGVAAVAQKRHLKVSWGWCSVRNIMPWRRS